MKKALSLILAIVMLLTMTVGFGSSAEVKNLLPLDEEGTNIINQTAYAGSFGPNGSITLPAFGSWIADGVACKTGSKGTLTVLYNKQNRELAPEYFDTMANRVQEFIHVSNLLLASDYYSR